MKRFAALSGLCIALSSCATASDLAPDEVLRRSTQANAELTSARFSMEADIAMPEGGMMNEAQVSIEGIAQNGGKQLQMQVEASGSTEGTSLPSSWEIDADIVVAGQGETYVKLDRFETEPSQGAAPAALIGKWWLLPAGTGAAMTDDVTPDPRMLRMQTEIIDIVSDEGIVSLDGRRAHRYQTRVNEEKLASFLSEVDGDDQSVLLGQLQNVDIDGELWIDAETYHLLRADWQANAAEGSSVPTFELSLNIRDHNAGVTVTPPSSAQPLPIESLFPLLPLSVPTNP